MPLEKPPEPPVFHQFKNQLAIILGFSSLLLEEMSQDDSHRDDIVEIQKAGEAAVALLPELASQLK
jgi:hypothetical protein